MNTEDKLSWCEEFGEEKETNFLLQRNFAGTTLWINPDKVNNKYANDFVVHFPSDLKTVRTPLFMANEMYGIDPQYAVTFNVKDGKRYAELYPNIIVVFDIRWEEPKNQMDIKGNLYRVEPMELVVAGFLKDIKNAILASDTQKIGYKRRVNDTQGNAKESFVFDARHLQQLKETT